MTFKRALVGASQDRQTRALRRRSAGRYIPTPAVLIQYCDGSPRLAAHRRRRRPHVGLTTFVLPEMFAAWGFPAVFDA
jgi:hypothetical protein